MSTSNENGEIRGGVFKMFKKLRGKFSSQAKKSSPLHLDFRKLGKLLTKPSVGMHNNGEDNREYNLIVRVGDSLCGGRYVVHSLLGSGVYGQVYKAEDTETGNAVAVKIIKNKTDYRFQAQMEIEILQELKGSYNLEERFIVDLINVDEHKNHVILVFEILGSNLYEILQYSKFEGLDIRQVATFTKQIILCLEALSRHNIIHCDLKPENVLVSEPAKKKKKSEVKDRVKVVDFGSATYEHLTGSFYVQSRFYRAPEVLLGIDYDCQIDMWSVACMCAELYIGRPIFAGSSSYDQISKIVRILGPPSDNIIESGKISMSFFESGYTKEGKDNNLRHKYMLKNIETYRGQMGNCELDKPLRIFVKGRSLKEVIMNKDESLRKRKVSPEVATLPPMMVKPLNERKLALVDFLGAIFRWDKLKRLTPRQALTHPFLTGEPFTGTFRPPKSFFTDEKIQRKAGIKERMSPFKRWKLGKKKDIWESSPVSPNSPSSPSSIGSFFSKPQPIQRIWDDTGSTSSWYGKPVLGQSPNLSIVGSFSPAESPNSPSSANSSPSGSLPSPGSYDYFRTPKSGGSWGSSLMNMPPVYPSYTSQPSTSNINSFGVMGRGNDWTNGESGRGGKLPPMPLFPTKGNHNEMFKKILRHNRGVGLKDVLRDMENENGNGRNEKT